jgi:putative SOS response-associated peptidase YedK
MTVAEDEPEHVVRYNIAPGRQAVIILRDRAGRVGPGVARWGFTPPWSKPGAPRPINARAETLQTNRMFAPSLGDGRCIVPADCFYEWTKGRPGLADGVYRCHRIDGAAFWFAGLRIAGGAGLGDSFAIVTTPANALVATLHDRMPVLLDRADAAQWLTGQGAARDIARLTAPRDWQDMTITRANRALADTSRDGPELWSPDPPPAQLRLL